MKKLSFEGQLINENAFEELFSNSNTYEELPAMLSLVAHDVTRSKFDSMKEHAVCYHISGMVDLVYGVKNALKILEDEVLLLGLNLDDEMDMKQARKLRKLQELLKSLE